MTQSPRQVVLSLFPRLPLPFLLRGPFQRGKDLGSDPRALPSSPHASEPGPAFQHKAWEADKNAGLNSVSSPVLGVIMMPCPVLLCPARLTQGALQVAEGGAGPRLMGQRRLQQCPEIRDQNPNTSQGTSPLLTDPPGHLGAVPGTRAQCRAPGDAPLAPVLLFGSHK